MAKKVLFLTLRTFSFTGGIEKICRSVARAFYSLEKEGLITMQTFSMYDAPWDLDTRYLPASHFRGFGDIKLRFVLQAVLHGIKCDKVVLSHINLLPVAFLIKLLSPRTRIVLFGHGIEIWREKRGWERRFLRKKVHQVWAVSEYTAGQVARTHGVDRANIRVINNCIDPFFDPPKYLIKPDYLLTRYNLNASQPVLLTLTRLSSFEAYKGYNMMLECLPELIRKFPDIRYLIAGKADNEERLRLEKLIEKNRLDEHVTLIGFIPEHELDSIFLLADIFIMPSKKEGFGIVFIEAATCGCNIIAGNEDGSPDALLNGRLGQLIDPDDKQEMVASISRILERPKSAKRALDIQAICVGTFNFENYTENIKQLLKCE